MEELEGAGSYERRRTFDVVQVRLTHSDAERDDRGCIERDVGSFPG
jgi:hypothetical protein